MIVKYIVNQVVQTTLKFNVMKKYKIEKSSNGKSYLVDRNLPLAIGEVKDMYSYFGTKSVINSNGNCAGTIEKDFSGQMVFKKSYSCLPPVPIKSSF